MQSICLDIVTMHNAKYVTYCYVLPPHTVYTVLRQFEFFILSLENDVMATSKRCVKLFSLIFILKGDFNP